MTNSGKIYRYCPCCLVSAALALGWKVTDALVGTHHGVYAILLEWSGECTADFSPPWPEQSEVTDVKESSNEAWFASRMDR